MSTFVIRDTEAEQSGPWEGTPLPFLNGYVTFKQGMVFGVFSQQGL